MFLATLIIGSWRNSWVRDTWNLVFSCLRLNFWKKWNSTKKQPNVSTALGRSPKLRTTSMSSSMQAGRHRGCSVCWVRWSRIIHFMSRLGNFQKANTQKQWDFWEEWGSNKEDWTKRLFVTRKRLQWTSFSQMLGLLLGAHIWNKRNFQ